MSDLSPTRSPQQTPSPKNMESISMSLKWLTLLNVHYKAGLSTVEIELYLEPLFRNAGHGDLEMRLSRCCREECFLLPGVADIVSRIAPEKNAPQSLDQTMQTAEQDKASSGRAGVKIGVASMRFRPTKARRWTAEDGWIARDESLRREVERDSHKRGVKGWHAPIKGPRIRS